MNIGDAVSIFKMGSTMRGRVVSFDKNIVCIDVAPQMKNLIFVPYDKVKVLKLSDTSTKKLF